MTDIHKITAKVIADSISPDNLRVTTLEIDFWRPILAEQNTHRVFSRNVQSSRAVPTKRAIELLDDNSYLPQFTRKGKGMRSVTPVSDEVQAKAAERWNYAKEVMKKVAADLDDLGVSKQYAGRLLEPFQITRGVITGVDWDNYFNLRIDDDAQPEIRMLATAIREARERSEPIELGQGDWHLPYFREGYYLNDDSDVPLRDAQMISVSCCAQVSYRRLDTTLDKAESIVRSLISGKLHASPFEHQVTPKHPDAVQVGNLRGWTQLREQFERGN